jgi:hypothetical protein
MNNKSKFLIGIGLIMLFAFTAKAQTDSIDVSGRTYQQVFDSISPGLIKSRVPYGVLYNRVSPGQIL